MTSPVGGPASTTGSPDGFPAKILSQRLRTRRQKAGLSLRELARRVGVSPSLVSQIETGKAQPSVSTLYAFASELGGSIDELLFDEAPGPETEADTTVEPPPTVPRWESSGAATALAHPPIPPVQRAPDRKAITLSGGVRWERLTSQSVPGVEFLFVVYEPGAESSPPDAFQRHSGREWGYVISGTLHVAVGFDEHVLGPGDAITYDSMVPHRLTNPGTERVEAVWFQLD